MKSGKTIGKVAKELGVSICSLRRWDKLGKLTAAFRTLGGHRRDLSLDVFKLKTSTQRLKIGYAGVSSHDQKEDLQTQMQVLEHYASQKNLPSLMKHQFLSHIVTKR